MTTSLGIEHHITTTTASYTTLLGNNTGTAMYSPNDAFGLENKVGNSNLTSGNFTLPPHPLVEYYINGVLAIIVIFLGVIANIVTIVVLTRRTMHSSTNFFLTALALWDTFVLLSTLMLITLKELSVQYLKVVFPYTVAYIYPFALVAQTSTIWITVSFTVERYIAVCHPLKAATMCTHTRAKGVVIIVSVLAFLYNISRWFEYKVTYTVTKTDNQTTTMISYSPTEFGSNTLYSKLYFFYLYPLIMFIIPLSTLAVLNTSLILAVKRSRRQQKDMNVRQSRENNVTIMLVSVVIVFMFCQVPAMVYNVAWSIDNKSVNANPGWMFLSSIRNFLVTFNSAINFILYCAFGQKFRRIFMRTFCQCFPSDANDFNSLTYHGTHGVTYSGNKKQRRLLCNYKGSRGDNMEMSSNVTQHTLLSKYSPNVNRSVSPEAHQVLTKYENGRYNQKLRNGQPQDAEETRSRLLKNSRTPSPV